MKNLIIDRKTILFGLFAISMVIYYGCNKDDMSPASPKMDVISSEYLALQSQAQNLAKVLAYDLNRNEEHRKEIFGRIANKFDGDYNMLLSHLSQKSADAIQKTAVSNAFKKVSVNVALAENFLTEIVLKLPKLQLMMPFADSWTDEKIQQAGGLIIAYYPFGIDDKNVKEITGYDKSGNKITITKETAPTIPYLIINMNERTDDNGYLKSGRQIVTEDGISIEKRKSIYGLDPKNISFTNKSLWKGEVINSLNTKNPLKVLKAMNEDGGGNPPPAQRYWTSGNLLLKGFRNGDVYATEPFWTNGDPEYHWKVKYAAPGQTSNGTEVEVILWNNYNGWTTWSWGWPTHHYRSDWEWYNFSWTIVNKISVQESSNIFVSVMEDDGGSPNSQPANGTITYSGVTFTVTNLFGGDDDLIGSYSFAQNLALPIQINLGSFEFQLDDRTQP